MPLIDRTYFTGDILLNITEGADAVDAAIATYEPEYLEAVLGAALYTAFSEGLVNPTGSDWAAGDWSDGGDWYMGEIDERWLWIRDGKTFVYNSRTYIWPGLVNSLKRSPLANYIYCRYRRDNATQTVGVGEVAPKSENSEVVSPGPKITRAWNKMVDWNRLLYYLCAYLTDDSDDAVYPEMETNGVDPYLFLTTNDFGI